MIVVLLRREGLPSARDAAIALGLLAVLVGTLMRRLPFSANVQLDLSTACILAAALILSPGLAMVIGALGALVANVFRRAEWRVAGFNGAQASLQGGIAAGLLALGDWDRQAPTIDLRILVLILVIGMAMHLANALAVGAILVFESRQRWWSSVTKVAWLDRTEALGYLAQWGLGLLAAVVADGHSWALVLIVLPGAIAFGALDQHARLRLRAEERLVHQAFHDTLTGLANRASFTERLEQALAMSDGPDSLALLFLDLDQFKVVNDTLGHAAGDQLLVEIARRLERAVRPGDVVARLGGDEFTVLLEGQGAMQEAERIAERIARAMQVPIHLEGREMTVSTSIGIARPAAANATVTDLMRDADIALYQAKDGGRARFVTYDPSSRLHVQERIELEADLIAALRREELRLVFQPKVELATGAIFVVEALLRWERPGHGLVSPGIFLPIAAESGLAPAIGRWVLQHACRAAAEWRASAQGAAPAVSVNVAAQHLWESTFVADVHDALTVSGLPGTALQLEVTEETAAAGGDLVVATMHRLRALGVGIVLDDFGTSHSNLIALGRLPVQALQLDSSFVGAITHSVEAQTITNAVIGLAHGLDMFVMAEGVETGEQLQLLRQWGCDAGQGTHFAPPMSVVEIRGLLTRQLPLPEVAVSVPMFAPPPVATEPPTMLFAERVS